MLVARLAPHVPQAQYLWLACDTTPLHLTAIVARSAAAVHGSRQQACVALTLQALLHGGNGRLRLAQVHL